MEKLLLLDADVDRIFHEIGERVQPKQVFTGHPRRLTITRANDSHLPCRFSNLLFSIHICADMAEQVAIMKFMA